MADNPSQIPDQTKGARLHKTNNDTKNNAKAASMEALQARLADGIDLALVTKQAHWNLKGPQFIGVHLMLDGFRTEQDEWNDMMAERITQLGGTARGTVQEVGRETKLSPYPTDIYAVADHRRYRRGRGRRHLGPADRNLPRRGQAALVPGGAYPGAERHLPQLSKPLEVCA